MASAVKIRGGDRLLKLLRNLPKEAQQLVKTEIRAQAEALANEARQLVPVDTGALKNSIKVRSRKGGLGAAVGVFDIPKRRKERLAGVAVGLMRKRGLSKRQAGRVATQLAGSPLYAKHIEFGTAKMPARPFLFPAYRVKKRAIRQGMARAAKDAIQKAK